MNLTCPCCHAKYPLDAALEGAAAGELLAVFTQAGPLARPLLAYLGMFRSKSRALSFDRACRLAREVLEIGAEPRTLAVALGETVEALRAKRDAGQVKPLTSHNYLKRVLESTALPVAPVGATPGSAVPTTLAVPKGKRAQAIAALGDWGQGDWLHTIIAEGLAALAAGHLDGTPAADVICLTADIWHHVLAGRCAVETLDARRVKEAFSTLLKTANRWPEPAAIWKHMGSRPRQDALDTPPPTADQVARDKQAMREIMEKIGGGMVAPATTQIDEESRRQLLQEQARHLNEGRS